MSRRLTRGLYAVAAALLAIVMTGSVRAGAAPAAQAVRPDQPQPGLALSVAQDNTWSYLFYTGRNGQVWQVRLVDVPHRSPGSMGGKLIGGPAAVWVPPGTLPISGHVIFGRGTDNRLWWRHQARIGWTAWAPLGGVLTSRPAVTMGGSLDPNSLSVFVRGSDGAVWFRTLHGTPEPGQLQWTPWTRLGGNLLPGTAPAATSNAAGLFVAATGTDHAVWVRQRLAGPTFGPWHSIGGKTAAEPGITSPAPQAVTAFIRGTDNVAWSNEFFGSTTGVMPGWNSLHGKLTSAVTAVPRPLQSRDTVFALGTDNLPWARGWPAGPAWELVYMDY